MSHSRLMHLNTWLPVSVAVWGGYGTFKRGNLTVGSMSLGVDFAVLKLSPISCSLCFLCGDEMWSLYQESLLPWLPHQEGLLSLWNPKVKQALSSHSCCRLGILSQQKKTNSYKSKLPNQNASQTRIFQTPTGPGTGFLKMFSILARI